MKTSNPAKAGRKTAINSTQENRQFLAQLSIERCRGYLSHMRAVLHVCGTGAAVLDSSVQENLEQMINILDLELSGSLKSIA